MMGTIKTEFAVGTASAFLIGATALNFTTLAVVGGRDGLSAAFILGVSGVVCGSAALFLLLAVILPGARQATRERHRLAGLTDLLHRRSEDYERAALNDPLTSLSSRRYFDEALEQYIHEFARIRCPLGLIVIDLDHFRNVNDTHGHAAGDQALKAIAAGLLQHVHHHDIAARYGGGTFAMIVPNLSRSKVEERAESIRRTIAGLHVDLRGEATGFTVSIGAANLRRGEGRARLVKRASKRLYQAKKQGRNQVVAGKGWNLAAIRKNVA